MPVLPFFALSDFGQMLVFFGVYAMLFFICVRRGPQLVYALLLSGLFMPLLYFGLGLPNRIRLRFYLWLHTWQAPTIDLPWWKYYFNDIQQNAYHGKPISNADAWFEKASQ